jgi:hypothetical protein
MNARREDLFEGLRYSQPVGELTTAAEIVVELENQSYARGWADGVDSTEKVEGGMIAAAFCAVAIIGAAFGAAITGAILIW